MLHQPHLKLLNSDSETKIRFGYSQKIIHKFYEACLSLDASVIEPLIEEDDILESKNKYLFLAELKKLFHNYQSKTNVFSVRKDSKMCLGCSSGKCVMQFTIYCDGTQVDDFGFVIDTEQGILKDIYRCWQYKNCNPLQIKPEGLPAIIIHNINCK